MCNAVHYRDSVYCKPSCRARADRNESYFAGRMTEAVGWDTKTCQACLVDVKKPRKFHVHHVYGHPDHSRLVVLCAGCHMLVSKMAWRKMDLASFERLLAFAFMQRDKKPLSVDIEILNEY